MGGGLERGDAPRRASGRGHLFLFRWRSNNVEAMSTLPLVDVVPGILGLIGRGDGFGKCYFSVLPIQRSMLGFLSRADEQPPLTFFLPDM